jgi:hypothetical protein
MMASIVKPARARGGGARASRSGDESGQNERVRREARIEKALTGVRVAGILMLGPSPI